MENQSFEQQAKNIIMEKLIKNYEKKIISINEKLKIEMIEKYPDKPWNWERISNHSF